jgi:hypothetical protein
MEHRQNTDEIPTVQNPCFIRGYEPILRKWLKFGPLGPIPATGSTFFPLCAVPTTQAAVSPCRQIRAGIPEVCKHSEARNRGRSFETLVASARMGPTTGHLAWTGRKRVPTVRS